VNFRGANLSGAKLAGSMASHADFSDARMSGVNMSGADLRGAQLEGADLSNADIGGAKMRGANTKSAILTGVSSTILNDSGADLNDAITDENVGMAVSDLSEPLPKLMEYHREWLKSRGVTGVQLDLTDMDLRGLGSLKMEQLTAIKAIKAKFFGMNLYKVEMQSATLDGSDFRDCDMVESDLRGTSFKGANFSHTDLEGANCSSLMLGAGGISRFNPCDFEGAVMRYAKMVRGTYKDAIFKDADLSYADLSGCDLRGADFTGAIMTNTNLDDTQTEGASFDRDESCPVFRIPTEHDTDEDA
ncbi:MAG: pentapeptide repeat-containing protein, partial [Alphaproteobacteria bacterium]|nr:pentapeptide repeat-containing protein [Alphaproteobacteria bacterium]